MTDGFGATETGTATCPFCLGDTAGHGGRSGTTDPATTATATAAGAHSIGGTSAVDGTASEGLPVVLDTNVLVSLYVFDDSRYLPLRRALEQGRLQALTSEACLGEFERVLAYPQFAFPSGSQREALAAYRRHARLIAPASGDRAPLPRCKDPDDQKFLELARDGGAAWLVTGDKALLVLARRQKLAHLFRILTPDAALATLQDAAGPERAERSSASAAA